MLGDKLVREREVSQSNDNMTSTFIFKFCGLFIKLENTVVSTKKWKMDQEPGNT